MCNVCKCMICCNCLDDWFKHKTTCPHCRQQLETCLIPKEELVRLKGLPFDCKKCLMPYTYEDRACNCTKLKCPACTSGVNSEQDLRTHLQSFCLRVRFRIGEQIMRQVSNPKLVVTRDDYIDRLDEKVRENLPGAGYSAFKKYGTNLFGIPPLEYKSAKFKSSWRENTNGQLY